MLADGVRLALVVVIPVAAAAVVHEVARDRLRTVFALLALAGVAALAASLAGDTAAGGTIERSFGDAIPGAALTVRADSAAITAVLAAVSAAVLALLAGRGRAEGLLLCVAGTAAVAVAGTLVLTGGGVMIAGTGVLLLTRPGGPGRRSAVFLGAVVGACGLVLIGTAAQLVAQSGSSDPTATPPSAIGGAAAVPWALAGAVLVVAPLLAGHGRRDTAAWASAVAVPAGLLVLLRLQQAAAGQLPAAASALLGTVGTLTALTAAVVSLRAREPRAALAGIAGVLAAFLLVLVSNDLAAAGGAAAAVVVALELAWLAGIVPGADRAGAALAAVPGGLGVAAMTLAMGPLVSRGPAAVVPVLVLVASAACAAIAAGRQVVVGRLPSRSAALAIPALAAALAGGVLPGIAATVAGRLVALGGSPVAPDAGSLRLPGSAWAGGYITVAMVVVVLAAVSARALVGDPAPVMESAPPRQPRAVLGVLVRLRRGAAAPSRGLRHGLLGVDRWLIGQPGVALVAIVAAVAVVAVR